MLSGDPANGTGFVHSGLSSSEGFMLCMINNTGDGSQTIAANFGQNSTFQGTESAGGNVDASGLGDFKYTVPTGFKALCSNNLSPESSYIIEPQKHFNTLTYTGDGSSSNEVTGLQFKPDLVWIKSRLATTEHILQDSVRGANVFTSIGTGAEGATGGGWVKNMNQNGFITDVNGPINTNGASYVAWCWKAGGASVTNNDGSIASQVSVNTEAGFSITGWTGTGSNATVGHGLGSAPEFIITKQRSTAGHHWRTYHKTVGATKSLYFDLNNAQSGTDAGFMNNTEPTSTVFSIGTDTNLTKMVKHILLIVGILYQDIQR